MTIPSTVESINYKFYHAYFKELVIGDNITFNDGKVCFDNCMIDDLKLTSLTKMTVYDRTFINMNSKYGKVSKISVPANLVSEYQEDTI